MRLPRRLLAGFIMLIFALLLTAALAACGDTSSDSGVATAGGGTGRPSASPDPGGGSSDPAERARKFAQCMRDHGIDVADPDTGPRGGGIKVQGDRAKLDAAMKACQRYAPGAGGANARPDPQGLARARRFAQCMRDHGVPDFPDPDPNGGIKVSTTRGSDLSPENPTFKSAQKACQSLMGPPIRQGTGSVSGGAP